ncbi:ABC transporter permease subunit [Corynebacterium cystitidis]|uniref:ABC transporter permease subunit n=1 Tax=Corynebacterium cystitidis TaxID=35757 RepID=UPI00211EC105|nr:ABC transporter permease subunit [Corynebacterium cystitidis]
MMTIVSRLVAILGLLVLIGLLPWLSTASPEYTILRTRYAELPVTEENLAAVRKELGLDQGPVQIFIDWFLGLLTGDLGTSWVSNQPIGPGMIRALGVSLTLMGFALVVSLVIAALVCVPIMVTGLRGRSSRGSGLVSVLLTSLPSFLLATFLLIIGALWLGWFPPFGWRGLDYAVLPSLALGIPTGGYLGRLLSDALHDTFREPWVETWRQAGANNTRLGLAVLRRGLPSVFSQIGLAIVGLTGGAVAVEEIFAIPGLGRSTLSAASSQDIPALQAGVLLLLIIAVLAGIGSELVRRALLGPAHKLQSAPVPAPSRYRQRRDLIVPLASGGLLAAIVIIGLLRDPYSTAHGRLETPSWHLPFGADSSGRDLLARVAHGTFGTVGMALLVTLGCLLIGFLFGLLGRAGVGFIEVANAAPATIAGLIMAAVTGPSLAGAALAVMLVRWAPLASHTVALLDEAKSRTYIQMLPILGTGKARTLTHYLIPDILPALIRHAALRFPGTALSIAGLGFLGLGASPPTPEWGLILSGAVNYAESAPWATASAASALVLVSILAVSLSSLPPRAPKTVVATPADQAASYAISSGSSGSSG